MTEIHHIVFDIGKVLVHYDPDLPFSRLIPDEAERKWFFDNVCTSAWNIEQDRGRTWEEAEAELLAVHPDHEENIRNFRRYWHEMVPYAYDDSVAIMEKLIAARPGRDDADQFRGGYFCRGAIEISVPGETERRHGFRRNPAIKPERAIYDHHVKAFGLEPAATIFIDDSQKNVDGAKAAGWQAVLFTDAPTLRRDLAARGIVV